jgi:DtxR family Mn-dependent transcriptional regulator
MLISSSEENYLKAIFKIGEKADKSVTTNSVAAAMNTTAASVTDMIKRLAEKRLVVYEKYHGVHLTAEGSRLATVLIRKHRLWEVFLVDKLGFSWDEVHELAEQLEHVQGDALIHRLDAYLAFPKFDPHGDPIPDAEGRWAVRQQVVLAGLPPGASGLVTGVLDHSTAFLQYLGKLGLTLGVPITLLERMEYDHSVSIETNREQNLVLSEKVAANLLITMDC